MLDKFRHWFKVESRYSIMELLDKCDAVNVNLGKGNTRRKKQCVVFRPDHTPF